MKFLKARLIDRLDSTTIACNVEEELRFHVEMLERKYIQQGMSSAEARAAATTRFGNFERVKHRCVEISRRSSPFRQALKISTILLGLTGLLINILHADYKVARIGTVLVFIAILGRLLLYVRGLSPSTFSPEPKRHPINK